MYKNNIIKRNIATLSYTNITNTAINRLNFKSSYRQYEILSGIWILSKNEIYFQ
jgi:hypothetical protein